MTIDTIRNKILEETGVDCYSKSRVYPIPDVKKIFYRACRDFADDYKNVLNFSKKIGVNRTTISHHLNIPLEWFLVKENSKTYEAYKLFYHKDYSKDLLAKIKLIEDEFNIKITHLKNRIQELSI